eukprot:3229581-Rhodomonas_salina.1
MSGTPVGYATTCVLGDLRYCCGLYTATRLRYATSGTETGYAATRLRDQRVRRTHVFRVPPRLLPRRTGLLAAYLPDRLLAAYALAAYAPNVGRYSFDYEPGTNFSTCRYQGGTNLSTCGYQGGTNVCTCGYQGNTNLYTCGYQGSTNLYACGYQGR